VKFSFRTPLTSQKYSVRNNLCGGFGLLR
jgi:hypothetical protein